MHVTASFLRVPGAALAVLLSAALTLGPAGGALAQSGGAPGYKLGERLPGTTQPARPAGFREINWDHLIPDGWNPADAFRGLDLARLQDGDPRADAALAKLREAWDKAPVEASLNGVRVRIPGFVVPLERDRDQISEFLLVPYFGACIHTPPPPQNQVIHVFSSKPLKNMRAMDTVWIHGTLETVSSDTDMARAGYRVRAELVTPYTAPARRN
ncbi:MAG: DUF3299 domain-containing protein [Burkholderiaceae bacterium]|nr:MAG: DUF3299 domain-containing protein [Burkholderiaceae bacterium]